MQANFLRSISVLVSGRGAAAAIGILLTPVIARLYNTDNFGSAALFISFAAVIGGISALSYDRAIIVAQEGGDADLLYRLCVRMISVVSASVLLLYLVCHFLGIELPLLQSLGIWAWVLPIGTFVLAIGKVYENVAVRNAEFGVIAQAAVVNQSLVSGIRIFSGLAFGSSVYGLVVSYVVGSFSGLVLLSRKVHKNSLIQLEKIKKNDLKRIATKYRDFPQFNAPSALVFTISLELPVFLFGLLFSPSVVGLYAMSNRLVHAPVRLVSEAIRSVYLRRASLGIESGENPRKFALQLLGVLFFTGLLVFGAVAYFASDICAILLGDRWIGIDEYVLTLIPWAFMVWVSVPFAALYVALRRQEIWLRLQIALLIARILVFVFAFQTSASAHETLWWFVAVTVAAQWMNIIVMLFLLRRFEAPESNGLDK